METVTLEGKVCLVTGATSGIGEVTALELAKRGARVLAAGRDPSRCQASMRRIQAAIPEPEKAQFFLAELSDLRQVKRLAEEVLGAASRLDVLVNNAGTFNMSRLITAQGYEATFAINHLAHFLLTQLLLDWLMETAAAFGEARIVNVSSDAHKGGRLNFADPMGEQRFFGWNAYTQSKLANIAFTFELSRRLQGSGVSANALHPGGVATRFGMNNGWLVRTAMNLSAPFSHSPEKGAQTSIYLASAPELRGVSGKYFVNCREATAAPQAYREEDWRRLWEASEKLTAVNF